MNQLAMNAPTVTAGKATDMVRYYDLAHEICVRANHDKSRLSDDERITLSVIAAQAALMRYAEPADHDSEATLKKLLRILDHHEMLEAMTRKMQRLLEESEHRSRTTPKIIHA